MADYLLRRIEHRLAGANWQRSGGKGKRPEPVALPGDKKASGGQSRADRNAATVERLRNLGLIPGGQAA